MSAERPLAGRRILNTRAFEQSGSLDAGLRALGAEPAGVPSIFFESPDDLGPLHEAARSIDEAAWVVFTSGTGVEQGWGAIREAWPDGLPAGVGVAAIGSGTASALAEVGAPVDFLPPEASGDALVATLPVRPGDRVVLLRSQIGREAIATGLAARGADVRDVTAYCTRVGADPHGVDMGLTLRPDAITFTSPSTVRGFLKGVGDLRRLDGIPLVPIGPVTAEALTDAGLPVARIPEDYTIPGLLDALVTLFSTSADAEAPLTP